MPIPGTKMDIILAPFMMTSGLNGVVVKKLKYKIAVVTFEIMRETYRASMPFFLEEPETKFRHTILSFEDLLFLFAAHVARFFPRMLGARVAGFLSDAERGLVNARFLSGFHVEEDVTETIVRLAIVVSFRLRGLYVTFMPGGKIPFTDSTPQVGTVVFLSFPQEFLVNEIVTFNAI